MSNAWSTPHLVGGRRQSVAREARRLWFESMEPRVMLAVDSVVGMPSLSVGATGGMTGSIGGSVLSASAAADCATHDAAVGMTEVRLQLLDATGTVIEETTTDAQGDYQFADLIPGDYTVRRIDVANDLALEQNEIAAIEVQGGEELTGFDFCQFEVTTSTADQSLAAQSQLAAVLGIVHQESTYAAAEILLPPTVSVEATPETVQSTPLPTVRAADFFGGSSRELSTSKSIKAWDEFPAMGLSSTLSLIGFANDAQAVEELLSSVDDSSDTPFADGYTANSLDWFDSVSDLEVRDLIGSDTSIELETEDEAKALPKLASRPRIASQQ